MQQLEQKWVMACIDGSELSDSVVDYAAWIAEKVNSPLELVHSIEHGLLLEHTDHSGNLTPNMRENLMKTLSDEEQAESKRLIEQGKQMLEKAKARITVSLKQVMTKQRHGELAETLNDLQDEIRVLVLGLRGQDHSESEHGIGSQLENSIRALQRPIFIVSGEFKTPRSMMLAYNETEGAQKALDMVCQSPLYRDMEIHLVHVTDNVEQGESLLSEAEQQLKKVDLNYQIAILSGDPQTQLLAYQDRNNLDMTVMGAFSHGKFRSLFFGSFTLKMLAHNNKPVLLLR
jgi:nucleotide-binding universal stress UspA family protein